MNIRFFSHLACATLILQGISCAADTTTAAAQSPTEVGFVSLFNGTNLDGWTPKIRGYPLGENFGNTFRVNNGVLQVGYENYTDFGGKFGHLFYKSPFTNYILRLEYRHIGEQVAGGPGWAIRNSGIMIHGQDPATMQQDQEFPVSLEVQLLSGDGSKNRTTANLCTPGTLVTMGGQLRQEHCIESTSKTYLNDQWVSVELEVNGPLIIHRVEGEEVIRYENPVLDENDGNAKSLIEAKPDHSKILTGGTISLQAESHPVEFRNIRIKQITP